MSFLLFQHPGGVREAPIATWKIASDTPHKILPLSCKRFVQIAAHGAQATETNFELLSFGKSTFATYTLEL